MSGLPDFAYDSAAVVVAADDTEIPVHAKLRKRYSQSLGEGWYGMLTRLDPNEDFWAIDAAGIAVLRTEHGQGGTFRPDTDNFTHVHGEITHMPIEGYGSAPF
jgi:hypothetical protein